MVTIMVNIWSATTSSIRRPALLSELIRRRGQTGQRRIPLGEEAPVPLTPERLKGALLQSSAEVRMAEHRASLAIWADPIAVTLVPAGRLVAEASAHPRAGLLAAEVLPAVFVMATTQEVSKTPPLAPGVRLAETSARRQAGPIAHLR